MRTIKTEKIVKMIKKEFPNQEAVIFANEDGIFLKGVGADVLALYTALTNQLIENGIPQDSLRDAVELATKSEEELIEILAEKIKKMKEEKKDE